MLPKLQEAEYKGDYHIWLKFADGVEGEIDFEKELWGEIFGSSVISVGKEAPF